MENTMEQKKNLKGKYHDEILFARHKDNPLITPDMCPYPINTIFNPAAAEVNGETVLLTRVEDKHGISHLTVARSKDGISDWKIDKSPSLEPEPEKYPEEELGIEDPRITWLEELKVWAITYTAVSKDGPLVSLATTKDFKTFKKLGPILRQHDKDAALFPKRVNGRWAIIHRPTLSHLVPAHMWISFSHDLKHWGDFQIIMRARKGNAWEGAKLGICPEPLETPDGWLILYHGIRKTCYGSIYRIGLALLDLDKPWQVIRRSRDWVMTPLAPYELFGDVGNVIFPCGWIHDKKTGIVSLYYGGADTSIALATAPMKEILSYMKNCPEK